VLAPFFSRRPAMMLKVCRHCHRVSCLSGVFSCREKDGRTYLFTEADLLDKGRERPEFIERAAADARRRAVEKGKR
jgi:hypothetical protein